MLCYWNSKLDALVTSSYLGFGENSQLIHPCQQNGEIDKAEHVMADYWQEEEVDVILFREMKILCLLKIRRSLIQILC